jgi:hypothetical protein
MITEYGSEKYGNMGEDEYVYVMKQTRGTLLCLMSIAKRNDALL